MKTHLTPEVLNLTKIVRKVRETVAQAWTADRLAAAESEYRRMLGVKVAYPDVDLVPSADVDEIWHAHILHTRQYAADCQALFGHFLHHEPNDGEDATQVVMAEAVANTRRLYLSRFGVDHAASGRCTGKTCHAPTPCRCR
jgi:hypothetical protein